MALKIKAIDDPAFATYGRALSLKTQDFLTVMDSRSIAPSATVVYDPSLKELESLALFDILQKQIACSTLLMNWQSLPFPSPITC